MYTYTIYIVLRLTDNIVYIDFKTVTNQLTYTVYTHK